MPRPEAEEPDAPSTGPSILAVLPWVVVLLASSLFTVICGWIGVRMLMAGLERSNAALGVLGATSLPIWFMVVVSAAIAAYALDRLSQ